MRHSGNPKAALQTLKELPELDDLLKGIKLCLDNANELLTRAKELRQLGHSGLALFLAQTAWEEVGKATILAYNYNLGRNITRTQWKKVLLHEEKLVAPSRLGTGLGFHVMETKLTARELDRYLKQIKSFWGSQREIGLYVDWSPTERLKAV